MLKLKSPYRRTVIWDGQLRVIEINASDTAPLVGIALLEGFELRVQAYEGKRDLIDRLLLEGISLAGISRAVKVSAKWLQTYVNYGGFWARRFLPKTHLKNMPLSPKR
jgi:hypothetical protein